MTASPVRFRAVVDDGPTDGARACPRHRHLAQARRPGSYSCASPCVVSNAWPYCAGPSRLLSRSVAAGTSALTWVHSRRGRCRWCNARCRWRGRYAREGGWRLRSVPALAGRGPSSARPQGRSSRRRPDSNRSDGRPCNAPCSADFWPDPIAVMDGNSRPHQRLLATPPGVMTGDVCRQWFRGRGEFCRCDMDGRC